MLETIKNKIAQSLLIMGLTSPITLQGDIIHQYAKEAYYSAYILTNFNRIVKEQEQKFNINHPIIPSIDFYFSNSRIAAVYVYQKNKIAVNLSALEESNSTNSDIDNYLSHELGHHLTNEICKNIGNNHIIYNDLSYESTISKVLVKEGIAEYYKLNNSYKKSLDSLLTSDEFPKTIEEWKSMGQRNSSARTFYLYTGGYALVKPIIDEFGSNGIELLVTNPPTINDLANLKKYQTNILERLRNSI